MDVFEGKSWISGQGLNHVCIGIEDGKISSVQKILKGDKHTKFQGVLLPGAFDMHVHFRDPGYPHKEDWKTGSESAAAGGVTAVVDMPNTNPFTSDLETFRAKESIAASKSVVDFGIGVNVDKRVHTIEVQLPPEREAGIKVENVSELVDKLRNEAKVI